jgi:hypothetical protein
LLKVGPGKTKKNPGKVLEKSWNFLTKKVYEPCGQNDLKFGVELQYGELYNASPFSGLEINIHITYM